MSPRASHTRAQRLTLAGSITGAAIVALDGTVLTVARPRMQHDLDASLVAVQWTSTAYLIAVACLLVLAGRLGDRYGHQRLFALGILGFAVTSAGIGLAPGVGWVIALRVAQGVCGALLQPATLGMLRAAYPADRLAMPIALRTSAIGLAAAAGPVVGGALTDQLGWRSVFFLTAVPAVAAGLLALVVRVPQPSADRTAGLDLPGAGLLAVALACLVHTLVGIPEHGWTTATALGLAAAVAAGCWFARHERRAASPLLPPAVLRSTTLVSALGVLLTASATLFGVLFLGTYFLQDVLGLDPLQSGLQALPLAVLMVLAAPVAPALIRRRGARWTTGAGMALITVGAALASRLDGSSGPVVIGCSPFTSPARTGPGRPPRRPDRPGGRPLTPPPPRPAHPPPPRPPPSRASAALASTGAAGPAGRRRRRSSRPRCRARRADRTGRRRRQVGP